MINTLFLDASEKRTVVGGNYNYVAKSLFPCSIRVLNKFGIEEDRFDNITSGFGFKLPSESLYKLEVTNNIYGQDIKIYSGFFEVKGINQFEQEYYNRFSSPGNSGSYSHIQIVNNGKKSVVISLNTSSTAYHVFATAGVEIYGTYGSTVYVKDVNSNNYPGALVYQGYNTSILSSTISYTQIKAAFLTEQFNNFKLPINRSLIVVNTSVSTTCSGNIKIKV